MIRELRFRNFKVLRDATLPLGPFTLLLGPNGSGKSTVFQGLAAARNLDGLLLDRVLSAGVDPSSGTVELDLHWSSPLERLRTRIRWRRGYAPAREMVPQSGPPASGQEEALCWRWLAGIQVFSFDARAIGAPVALMPTIGLGGEGSNLAGVLDRLRDEHPERFAAIQKELARWLPEFDQILFEVPSQGTRAIKLRTHEGGHAIPASDLSHGTLIALAMLTLAYLPEPPSLVCIEEPDRGIHPRLLRDVKDALYRLSHPDSCGESRAPVQVIATTHSPYLLDLFRDHPDEIILAQKKGLSATFERLSDRKDLAEILSDAHLGDVWYTGILGGVPDSD